jgi:hypothetical protein
VISEELRELIRYRLEQAGEALSFHPTLSTAKRNWGTKLTNEALAEVGAPGGAPGGFGGFGGV